MIVNVTCGLFPGKDCYENKSSARAALRRMPKHRKKDLSPYHCDRGCGYWHLGRKIRRARVAWRAEA